MKNIIKIIVILSFILSTNVFAHGSKHKQHHESTGLNTEAAKTVMSFHKALRTGNKTLARELLANDVVIFEGGNIEQSAEQYASHHMLSDMKYLAAVSSKTLTHQVKVLGNTAISMSTSHTKGEYKGKNKDYQGMETMVLEKQQGKWKIVHIHWSH